MEVETGPAPVGVGGTPTPVGFDIAQEVGGRSALTGVDIANQVPGTNVTNSGVKRDAERSIEDLEAEMEADRA